MACRRTFVSSPCVRSGHMGFEISHLLVSACNGRRTTRPTLRTAQKPSVYHKVFPSIRIHIHFILAALLLVRRFLVLEGVSRSQQRFGQSSDFVSEVWEAWQTIERHVRQTFRESAAVALDNADGAVFVRIWRQHITDAQSRSCDWGPRG